tara:strand:+ start:2511 stop:3140 length:630 start_codon:yes stop_codon:yes gene_type:complete
LRNQHNHLPYPPFLLITDRKQACLPLTDICAAASRAGCKWFMVREKEIGANDLTTLTRRIIEVVDPEARVVVNGNVSSALKAGASGMHFQSIELAIEARKTLPCHFLIGYSAHSISDAAAAERAELDYVTLSPIFNTKSKPGYGPILGLSGLRSAVVALNIPIIALAGICHQNASDVISSGSAGFAVMGEVMRSPRPEPTTSKFVEEYL